MRADGKQDSLTGGAHHRRPRRPRRSGRRCRRPRGQSHPRCSPQPSRCCQWWWRRPGRPPWTERPRARPSGRRGAPPQGRRPPGTSWTAWRASFSASATAGSPVWHRLGGALPKLALPRTCSTFRELSCTFLRATRRRLDALGLGRMYRHSTHDQGGKRGASLFD